MVSMLATVVCAFHAAAADAPPIQPLAVISLYNPTKWSGPMLVEVPVGRLAAPGQLDWRTVHLQVPAHHQATPLPFSIREGRAHWETRLTAPCDSPRPEDLLVFSCRVPSENWLRVEVLPGAAESTSAMTCRDGRITVLYPSIQAAFDEATGTLTDFTAYGEPMLDAPFVPIVARLGDKGITFNGPFATGYQVPSIGVDFGNPVPARTRLISSASTMAMTELNFSIEPEEGPALALTYRIHAFGLIEIALDGRPWTGQTPWLTHAVRNTLTLKGNTESLPLLETRMPFYGFKEYAAATREVAKLHRGKSAALCELGDEAVNGRRFTRRIFAVPNVEGTEKHLAEAADEGLVVEVEPRHTAAIQAPVAVLASDDAPPAAKILLESALKNAGLDTGTQPAATTVRLRLLDDPQPGACTGDGFIVDDPAPREITIVSRTRLGLFNGAQAVARHLAQFGKEGGCPLIARNPVVPLRAGGFGGGNFEVDFPYGPDEEWRRVFDALLDSGMNVFGCLGMWGNWKMPVGYKYMPELRSDDPNAYDESSGAKFTELDAQREHGLALARYLQDRGAEVWLWIPIGCVPTTFAKKFPEAMAPGSDKIPCSSHPTYARYVEAFFQELLETYPIQGLFLIRDDNGGICTCDRCKQHVAGSRTKDPVWEQYLGIYERLRAAGFKGGIAVYPYNDLYKPEIDPLLPEDLYVVGHGAGASVLARDYRRVAPMGDTWLDNLYANFRIPPTPRMRRLLCDRNSFWIGGAYCGTELPWESVGFFGWEPTATPNSLRYQWGSREFGRERAQTFAQMNDLYEHLWDLNARFMAPATWINCSPELRRRVVAEGMDDAALFKNRLEELRSLDTTDRHARWFGHMELFRPFFEYHLNRLDLFTAIYDLVRIHRDEVKQGKSLSPEIRNTILANYAAIGEWAAKYQAAMQDAPDGMLTHCRWMTRPYKEWMAGYDQYLEGLLDPRQFAGTARLEMPRTLEAGKPFALRVELSNEGACPWVAGWGHRIEFSGIGPTLGLPKSWDYSGETVAPGERRTLDFQGVAPATGGNGKISLVFTAPFREPEPFIKAEAPVDWK